jgi:acyl carrier protein
MHQISTANDVRTIIAKHLGVEVKRVTDEAHFTYDLGADWLDRLELMIVIEDQFPAVEITDDDVDWAVGDDDAPIIEDAAPVISAYIGPGSARGEPAEQQKGCW